MSFVLYQGNRGTADTTRRRAMTALACICSAGFLGYCIACENIRVHMHSEAFLAGVGATVLCSYVMSRL